MIHLFLITADIYRKTEALFSLRAIYSSTAPHLRSLAAATMEIRDRFWPVSEKIPANSIQVDGLHVSQPPFRENKILQSNPIKKPLKSDPALNKRGLSAANPGCLLSTGHG